MATKTTRTARTEDLASRATDARRNGPVTKGELEILWTMAEKAMWDGNYLDAFRAVEALLCQADTHGIACVDYLPRPELTRLGELITRDGLQSLIDRVQAVNSAVTRRKYSRTA